MGRASTRYERLQARMFEEVEANELVHSASFQKEMDKTGADSKNRQKYDRYAVTSPCVGFDPNTEFEMKFQWAENAITLLRKAHLKFNAATVDKSSTVKVQLRGEGVLKMSDESNAWITYSTHIRAS